MSDGHCFISYSNADGLEFATKLATELEGGQPFINVWFDKNDMTSSGDDWDEQLASAISTSKCLLFVMSVDSTGKGSNCKEEWTWALKCKKPVICLVIGEKFEEQFRLNNRQKIFFNTNFDAGLAQLKLALARLDSPQGELDELNHRLAEAKRDLHRAKDEDKPRIQGEIEILTEQIARQEEIVRNPKAAEEKTEKNIQSGLERERQPEKPVAGKTSTCFINPPPGIAPNYFQDRLIETKQIVDFLNEDSKRSMTIVGRAGVGKTAIICRLLKGIESGQLPDDLGKMKADGIVYLSEVGSHKASFANIFADLSKLLSKENAETLEGLYKNPQTSTGDKMRALLDAFSNGRIILLLDNFENLIDSESLNIKDSELSDALNALLTAPQHTVKVIITTRIAPRDLALVEPGRQRPLNLDEGLESPYAENVLREMDADGRVGLKSAPDALLNKAREKTRGYPRALEALYAILSVDRYTTLEELLEISLPDEVVQKLVGEAFNRLDPSAQKVMQALAVYNRPVSPAAIDYLLQPHLPSIDSALVLNRLVNMHFARREAGRYYLHPADKEYAFSTIPAGSTDDKLRSGSGLDDFKYFVKIINKYPDLFQNQDTFEQAAQEENSALLIDLVTVFQNLPPSLIEKMQDQKNFEDDAFLAELSQAFQIPQVWTRYALMFRAADYFVQARKPRDEWKKLDDLAAQLAEFELRCEAGDYDTACSVLSELDYDYLLLWGHCHMLIDLHLRVKDKLNTPGIIMYNLIGLGRTYSLLGNTITAAKNYEMGLMIAQENKDRSWETQYLWGLGNCNYDLGETHKSIEIYEQALEITREIGNRKNEGSILTCLGAAYNHLGNINKAIEFYEQGLVISRETGNRRGEGTDLSNLGEQYLKLGEYNRSIEYYNQALQNARKIGNRYGEGKRLNGLAGVLIENGDLQNAIKHSEEALQIGLEMSNPEVCIESSHTLATAFLFSENLKDAMQFIQDAGKYDQPHYNFNISALHGIIALRQGARGTTQEAFTKSIAQADEILAKTPDFYSALDAKGLALCGLILCRGAVPAPDDAPTNNTGRGDPAPTVDDAIETFRKARKIAPHAGVVKSVLRLFDELVKCDEDGILKDVRKAVEGVE